MSARPPLLVAAGGGGLAALALVALVMTWARAGQVERALVILAIVAVAALSVGAGWAAWRRPALMRVGPEGLHLPLPWRGPLQWSRIHRIRRERMKRLVSADQEWLRIDPAPGVLPDYRWPTWRRLERWHVRRHGVRVPLSGLGAAPDTVVASVERFRPVEPAPPAS